MTDHTTAGPVDELKFNVEAWLKANGWLWHESHVVTPECMDELQAAIQAKITEAYEKGKADHAK